jgi:hypothetical protein
LAYAWWKQQSGKWQVAGGRWHVSRFTFHELLATALPGLGTAVFLLWRWWAGLPPLGAIYEQYWYQTTGFPGRDLGTAVQSILFNGPARSGEFTLILDFLMVFFLLAATLWTFRRLGTTYGLYSALLLLFMLLPTSANYKPLYSFSRYALAFFPAFMMLGWMGERPWLNRLILYPSIILYLYLSGQFFIWGWVA